MIMNVVCVSVYCKSSKDINGVLTLYIVIYFENIYFEKMQTKF